MEYLFFELFTFIIGGFLLLIAIYLLVRSINSNNWPCITGFIVSSMIDNIEYIGDEADRSFRAKITYKYSVENKDYTSKRVYFGDFLRKSWGSEASSLTKKYIMGNNINVFYNPRNAKDSVLEKGINSSVIMLLMSSFVFIGLGICLVKYKDFFISMIQ